ncbi:MAG: hypothetical protein FJW27_16620 [Acidimicrobiia bacterium]|nr:hypothetical protein [Acidimicrobiia bacterium]
MVNKRSALVLGIGAVLVTAASLLAQGERKLSDAEKKEFQTIVKVVDGPPTGQPAANDLALSWVHNDLLKAQGNMQYVPFTVAVDAAKIPGKQVALYWRVVDKNPPPAGKDDKDKDKNKKKNAYAYEDMTMAALDGGGLANIHRSFTVAPGNYEITVVAKEPTPRDKKAPAPKMSLIKQSIEIPNLWTAELTTSSILLGNIEELPAPLTPQQQAERPYAMGAMEIKPNLNGRFSKQQELSTFMLIYNARVDAANKPDVTVDYSFYVKQNGAEKFFNKTNAQALNAQTLPPGFDFAAGHQLQTGQAVPLASFPEGDYRLEIKVTDKLASKTLTRDVNFSVSGS